MAGVTTLTAFYDLAVGPVSFDIIPFLVQAEIERRNVGAERMHVVLVGDVRKKPQYDSAEASWRLWNICLPAPRLFGATVTLAADWLQAKRLASEKSWKQWPPDWDHQNLEHRWHLIGGVIDAANRGTKIPLLKASEAARRAVNDWFNAVRRPVVTMTLRNTYLKERNANRQDWMSAARHIESRGFHVVLMEDTGDAMRQGRGYGELNLDLRMACYQEANLNLQANNGTASLCWFSERPYRMFSASVPEEEWHGLFVRQGLPLGASWPWALPEQRLIYGPTSRDQIVQEFETWVSGTKS